MARIKCWPSTRTVTLILSLFVSCILDTHASPPPYVAMPDDFAPTQFCLSAQFLSIPIKPPISSPSFFSSLPEKSMAAFKSDGAFLFGDCISHECIVLERFSGRIMSRVARADLPLYTLGNRGTWERGGKIWYEAIRKAG